MSKVLLLIAVLAAAAIYLTAGNDAVLQPDEYARKLAELKPDIIDVRTPEEYQAGHIKGAENINFYDEDFAERIKAKPKDKTYFIYCRSGGRSGKTLAMMQEAGFKVFDLKGGMMAWEGASKPVVK